MAGFYVNLAILFITIPRLASKHYQYCFSRQRNLYTRVYACYQILA